MEKWCNVWLGYLAPIMGERGPLGNSHSLPPTPRYAKAFGFICMEAEAMRMRNRAGSGMADVVTKEKLSNE